MGNEVKGVQQCVVDNCDMCIEIPQYQNCNINKSFIIIKRKREILSDAAKIFLEIINDNYADM